MLTVYGMDGCERLSMSQEGLEMWASTWIRCWREMDKNHITNKGCAFHDRG